MHYKLGKRIIIFIFAMLCSSWVFWFFLQKYFDSSNNENRELSVKPVLTIDNISDYPTEFESYLNDNIPFRNSLISLNSKIDFFLFKKTSSELVTIGKNGWLFFNPTLADYQKTNLYTDEELDTIKNNADS